MTLHFAPQAEADFAAVIEYLAERNPVAAQEFGERIFALIDKLAAGDFEGPERLFRRARSCAAGPCRPCASTTNGRRTRSGYCVSITRRSRRSRSDMSVNLRVRAIDETGAPVPGALVRSDDETLATTDADGVATVGIDTGFDCVTVSHSMPAEVQLLFSLGEGSSGVIERTVTLRRGAPLFGTVTAPDGSPLPDAIVEVWTAAGTTFVESDDEGCWQVPAMQAGPYEVRASAQGYARGPAIVGTHDGRTEQRGVALRVASGARLHGRVRNTAGPVAGTHVYAEMRPGDDCSATTDTDGTFEIVGLGPGRHHVSVGSWRSSVVMPGDGGDHEFEIELPDQEATPASSTERQGDDVPSAAPPTATLTGRVVRNGAPVSQFAIVRKGLAGYRWITQPAIIHSPDGRFTLTGLRESSCTVHALALGSAWASTATIALEPGATLDIGDIELPPGFRVAGTVCNVAGDPVEGARIVVAGGPGHDDPFMDAVQGNFATVSRSDGTFLLDGIHLRARTSDCPPRIPLMAHRLSIRLAVPMKRSDLNCCNGKHRWRDSGRTAMDLARSSSVPTYQSTAATLPVYGRAGRSQSRTCFLASARSKLSSDQDRRDVKRAPRFSPVSVHACCCPRRRRKQSRCGLDAILRDL